jgi:hypothetical protein
LNREDAEWRAGARAPERHVSCSPSKIPYVGFSPVRLQTGIRPRPSPPDIGLKRRTRIHPTPGGLYVAKVRVARLCGPKGKKSRLASREQPSPEALGSPAGYVVPPGHRLLRPHPKLSAPPAGLSSSSRRVSALRSCMGWNREAPQFPPRVCTTMPSPVPRRTGRLHIAVPSPPTLAFVLFARTRHPYSHAHRFPRGLRHEAAEFASCYGLVVCSPFTGKDFYFRAFTSLGHPSEASDITTRAHS